MGQPQTEDTSVESSQTWAQGRVGLRAKQSRVQKQILTHRLQWGAPEELIELGEVHDHAELVGLLG